MQRIDCEKNYYLCSLRIIDINDRFNVHSIISYYNIYEREANENYFRWVTLKTVHPNNRQFRPYDIVETLDKQYLLVGYHSFVKSGQRIMVV